MEVRGRSRRRLLVACGAAAAVSIAAVVGLYLWAASYRPFGEVQGAGPRAGVVRVVEPGGSDRRRAFVVRPGPRGANVQLDVVTRPRWGFTLVGVDSPPASPEGGVGPVAILGRSALPGSVLRLLVHYRAGCRDMSPGTEASTSELRLRYRYLHWFERTQTVELPVSVTVRC